jgi:roadblock/LC7 domain-containing protein
VGKLIHYKKKIAKNLRQMLIQPAAREAAVDVTASAFAATNPAAAPIVAEITDQQPIVR